LSQRDQLHQFHQCHHPEGWWSRYDQHRRRAQHQTTESFASRMRPFIRCARTGKGGCCWSQRDQLHQFHQCRHPEGGGGGRAATTTVAERSVRRRNLSRVECVLSSVAPARERAGAACRSATSSTTNNFHALVDSLVAHRYSTFYRLTWPCPHANISHTRFRFG
jgi:hypothetical protein